MSDHRNQEIGLVSSSFLFRACRACRACGRGEAAWAHVDRYPYRWASRVLGSTWFPVSFVGHPLCAGAWVLTAFLLKTRVNALCGHLVAHLLCTGAWVLTAFGILLRARAPFVVAKSMGFNTWTTETARQCMGFKRYLLKTRANASNKHVNALKTHVNSGKDSYACWSIANPGQSIANPCWSLLVCVAVCTTCLWMLLWILLRTLL